MVDLSLENTSSSYVFYIFTLWRVDALHTYIKLKYNSDTDFQEEISMWIRYQDSFD